MAGMPFIPLMQLALTLRQYTSRALMCISERVCMLGSRGIIVASNVLDLALSYLALLVIVIVVHPVLNKRLLEIR
jgi:hypothetical protein